MASPHLWVGFSSQPMFISSDYPLQISTPHLHNFPAHRRRFCPAPISSFLSSADVFSCSKRQCVAFALNIFSCVMSLCIHWNFRTNWQSCQPMSQLEFLNSLFDCLVVGCRRGRRRGTQKCHKVASRRSSIVFGRLEENSKGHMGIGWGLPNLVLLSEPWETGLSHHPESGYSWSG